MNKYIEADTDPAAWKISYVSADGTNKTAIHGHNAIGDYKAIDADATSEPIYALAQPVQAESKPCFMCHGQGWHYIAHAYPPGVTVPKVKIACTQCVAQPVQSVEAQLVPLTDKQIYDLWPSECMAFCEEAAEFARAIEAHHGIKPAGTQPIRTPK